MERKLLLLSSALLLNACGAASRERVEIGHPTIPDQLRTCASEPSVPAAKCMLDGQPIICDADSGRFIVALADAGADCRSKHKAVVKLSDRPAK